MASNVCESNLTTYEARHWPINWSAVFAGTLAAFAVAVIAGLAGVALGAQMVGYNEHVTNWHRVQVGGLIWTVCSAFFSFVVGGWVAGKISGYTHCEHSILHATIAWLVAIPMFILLATLGAGGYLGGWYSGLAGAPSWATARVLPEADAYAIVRNNALGAVSALLLGLIGSVVGGWWASGRCMTLWGSDTNDNAEKTTVTAANANVAMTR